MSCCKLPQTYQQQLDILKNRGLIVADEPVALHCLEHHNYYRLSAYRFVLTNPENPDQFLPETTFEQLWGLYCFDRQLRLLVMEAVKRLEISVRSHWAYVLAHARGPQAYEDVANFHDAQRHTKTLAALDNEIARSHEVFVNHFQTKYSMPRPPVWAACEVMSFGLLSRFYENYKRISDRKKIARAFDLFPETLKSTGTCNLHSQPLRPPFPPLEPEIHHYISSPAASCPDRGKLKPGRRPAHLQHTRCAGACRGCGRAGKPLGAPFAGVVEGANHSGHAAYGLPGRLGIPSDVEPSRPAFGTGRGGQVNAPAYPKTKKSGVEWLGDIPEHWEVRRLKFAVSCNDETLPENTDSETEIGYVDISSVSLAEGITCTETLSFEKAPSRARRKVRDGDTIVSTVRTYLKAIAPINKPSENLIVSTGFAVIRPLEIMEPSFLGYFLQSQGFVDSVVANSKGVSYPAINPSELVCIPVSYPKNKNEQKAIAEFLDRKTGRIDELIGKKKELIGKLNEQRSALITSAVTGKLQSRTGFQPVQDSQDGCPTLGKMKDSGVEWLGRIPEHWDIKRLRYLGICQNGINAGAEKFGSGFPFVSYGDVYRSSVLTKHPEGLVESTEEDRIIYSVLMGDVLFTRTSETIDEIGFASTCLVSIPDSSFAGFLIRFRPESGKLLPDFSKHYFRNQLLRRFFIQRMNLVTRASLSQDLLKMMPVLLPPIDEQRAIAEYLDEKTGKIDGLIRKTETAIQTLEEYRTALITAAVTGKIDVRKAV